MTTIPPLIWIASVYGVMSIVTLIAYGIDKRQAVHGRWRVPERRLHLLELLDGWPGAIVGQALFHHKHRKFTYMLVFAVIVVLHAAVWFACRRAGLLQ